MKPLEATRFVLLNLTVVFAAGLLFVNVYNSIVDATNWGSHLPGSVEAARAYFRAADPGTFFRLASPLNQLISLATLAVCWKVSPRMRLLCGLVAALALANDVFTFAYFYPRNAVMFEQPLDGRLEAIKAAAAQWSSMNWIRSLGVATGLLCAIAALTMYLREFLPSLRPLARQTSV